MKDKRRKPEWAAVGWGRQLNGEENEEHGDEEEH